MEYVTAEKSANLVETKNRRKSKKTCLNSKTALRKIIVNVSDSMKLS